MQAAVFCGIQASGKSTFYRERFFGTHVRINLDMLKTRHRETRFIEACLGSQQRFVVDNTNPTRAERARYVHAALAAGFETVCYYFEATPRDAIGRNQLRAEAQRIPVGGILGTYKRFQLPSYEEGFSSIYRVTLDGRHGFVVTPVAGLAPAAEQSRISTITSSVG